MRDEEAGGAGIGHLYFAAAKNSPKRALLSSSAEMIFAGGKWDTFRMLTHPGIAIMPAALRRGRR